MNRLTAVGRRGWGDWKNLAKEHMCVYAKPMDTDSSVVQAGVGGMGENGARL